MARNKALPEYRVRSFRVEKQLLQQFQLLCNTFGITFSTGLRWLIEEAIQRDTLKPIKRKETPSEKSSTGDDKVLP